MTEIKATDTGTKISEKNGLSADQITLLLRPYGITGVPILAKNQLPSISQAKLGWYIINMQDSTAGPGTHWVCMKYNGKNNTTIYFDSFAVEPPEEVMRLTGKNIVFNNKKQIQDVHSTCCGWFCIAAIVFDRQNKMAPLMFYNRFLSMFSKNTRYNDYILKNILETFRTKRPRVL